MAEPAAGIFAPLLVLLAAFLLLRAVRGRFPFRPKTFRLGVAAEAVFALSMAVDTILISTPAIFGLSWSIRGPLAGLAIFIGIASAFTGLLLLVVDPHALGAYIRVYMPGGLYYMLFRTHDQRPTNAGE